MTSPLYYAVLIALLAILVVVLVLLIRKRKKDAEAIRAYQEYLDKKREERKAEEEKNQPNWRFWEPSNSKTEKQNQKWRHGRQYVDDETYIPKYAAGDEMDSLRPKKQQKQIFIPTPVLIVLIALFIAGGYALHGLAENPVQPEASEKLDVEIVSTERNQEGTKIYVTLNFENQTINPCYNIVTTITLEYGDQTADTEILTLSILPTQAEQEEIITLDVPEEYRNQAYTVNAKSQYKWRIA